MRILQLVPLVAAVFATVVALAAPVADASEIERTPLGGGLFLHTITDYPADDGIVRTDLGNGLVLNTISDHPAANAARRVDDITRRPLGAGLFLHTIRDYPAMHATSDLESRDDGIERIELGNGLVLNIVRDYPASPLVSAASPERTLHVNAASPIAGTGSSEFPFQTIGAGLAALRPGDTLVIAGGTYIEDIDTSGLASATERRPITIEAKFDEHPVLKGSLELGAN